MNHSWLMNGLQSCSFKWKMSKRMPKTLSSFIEEAQKHIIIEVLYFIENTHSTKEESKRIAIDDPSRPTHGRSERPYPNKGKKKYV